MLLRALRLTVGDLPVLAERLPDEGQRGRAVARGGERRAADAVRTQASASSPTTRPRALALVERAPIGTVDSLLHLPALRRDGVDLAGTGRAARQSDSAAAATALLCDAAVASVPA